MSNYRDDREAQRARAAALEVELAAKNRELAELKGSDHAQERLDQLERDLAAAQAAVAALKRERAPAAPSPSRPITLVAVLVAVAAAGGLVWMLGHASPPPMSMAPPRVVELAPQTPILPAPVPVTTVATTAEPEPARHATATWQARVAKSSGIAVAGACTLRAELIVQGKTIIADHVNVSCGKTKLYASDDEFSGTSLLDFTVREIKSDKPGLVRFSLVWEDKGERTASSQASLNTPRKSGSIWSTTAPAFNVDLTLEEKSTEDAEPLLAHDDAR